MAFFSVFKRINQTFQHTFFPPSKGFIYVALGDSAVEGIGASAPHRSYTGIIYETLKEAKKDVTYHNLGKDGAKIKHVLLSQLDHAIALKPDLVTISIGANDVRGITRVRTFEKALVTLFHRLRSETDAEIVINTIPDLSVTPRIPKHAKAISRLMVQRLNRIIEKYAKEYAIILVDMYEQVRVYGRIHPEIIGDDGFHPSDFGYAMWANTVLTEINHIVYQKNEMQFSFNYQK